MPKKDKIIKFIINPKKSIGSENQGKIFINFFKLNMNMINRCNLYKNIPLRYLSLLMYMLFAITHQGISQNLVLDKIIARVNDEVIFKSELDDAIIQYKFQFGDVNEKEIEKKILNNMVISKIFLSKKDIRPELNDSMIELAIKERVNYLLNKAGGSEKKLEKNVGMSMRELKKILRKNITEHFLITSIQNSIVNNMTVSIQDVKSFMKNNPQKLPIIEPMVILKTLVKYPYITDVERESIVTALNQVKKRILNGESFEAMVEIYSEDQSTKQEGGKIGFYWKKGDLIQEYETAALKLKPVYKAKNKVDISDPVETVNGFYLIQMLKTKGNEYLTRHILIRPKDKKEQLQQAIQYLNEVKNNLFQGKTTFEQEYQKLQSNPEEHKLSGYLKTDYNNIHFSKENLPPYIDHNIFNQKKGAVVGPIVRTSNNKAFAQLFQVEEMTPRHKINLKQDFDRLVQLTKIAKRKELLQQWIDKIKKESVIYIDPKYSNMITMKLDM